MEDNDDDDDDVDDDGDGDDDDDDDDNDYDDDDDRKHLASGIWTSGIFCPDTPLTLHTYLFSL